jgi:hypothetical protein
MPKSISIKKWKKFLKSQGLINIRTESSHEVWDNPNSPLPWPVIVKSNLKDVPLMHIHTGLSNMGISKAEYIKILETL